MLKLCKLSGSISICHFKTSPMTSESVTKGIKTRSPKRIFWGKAWPDKFFLGLFTVNVVFPTYSRQNCCDYFVSFLMRPNHPSGFRAQRVLCSLQAQPQSWRVVCRSLFVT